MIATKLLDTQRKELQRKPAYEKPKYKTYKQLLELNKPKKEIHYESDNEGDDFLEKLLKEEKEEKKKKKKHKVHARSKNQSQKDMLESNIAMENIQTQRNSTIKKQVPEQNKINIENISRPNPEFNTEKITSMLERVRGNSAKRVKSIGVKTNTNEIMIDETDQVGLIIVNNFQPSCTKVKSIQSLKKLKADLQGKKSELKPCLVDNVKTKMIMHKVQDKKNDGFHGESRNQWMRRFINQQIQNDHKHLYLSKKRMTNRQTLFKNEREEERFVEHLKTYRKKTKFSI